MRRTGRLKRARKAKRRPMNSKRLEQGAQPPRFDLHIHTTASDGTDSPEAVVALAAEKGFSIIAITDHDTMRGVPEAVAAGEKYGVLKDVISPAGRDIYVVSDVNGGEFMIPAVDEFVREIDIDGGRILVHLIEGMRE